MAAHKSAKKTSGKAGRNEKNFDCYAVDKGRNTGIFTVWDLSHHASVDRYPNNIYKGFEDVEQAVDVFDVGPTLYKCYTDVFCLPGMAITLQFTFCISLKE